MSERSISAIGPAISAVAIVIPVHNDWASLVRLLRELNHQLIGLASEAAVFVVDDGSTEPVPVTIDMEFGVIRRVTIIELAVNLGHQRAIAIGLAEAAGWSGDCVIVMDADGEDRPEDVRSMLRLHQSEPNTIMVAQRTKRTESVSFKLFYQLYKAIFLLATGTPISHGNFCLIPRSRLNALLHSQHTWNNLAASIARSKVPYYAIPTVRGTRYHGQSQMSFISLLLHGLGAISVYLDVLSARILTVCTVALSLLFFVATGLVLVRLLTDVSVPGWTTLALGLLAVLMMQMLMFSASVLFSLLSTRAQTSVIPDVIARSYVRARTVLLAQESKVARDA
jgi:hypothetical protein